MKKQKPRRIRFIIKSKTARKFVEKYRRRGVDEVVIGKALLWARNYAEGIVEMVTDDAREHKKLVKKAMPRALEKAEKWIEGVME